MHDEFLIPLIKVAKELGISVEKISEDLYQLNFDSKSFLLNLEDATFVRSYDGFNCMIAAPGSRVYKTRIKNDLYIDTITARTIIQIIGVKVNITIDNEHSIVQIYKSI